MSETARREQPSPSRPRGSFLLLWFLGSLLLGFILLPILKLGAAGAPESLVRVAGMAEMRQALWLSFLAAFIATCLAGLTGVPLAYVLSRSRFRGRNLVAAVVDMPLAIPHTVAGIALLMVFGRQGPLGAPAEALLGLKFWGTIAGVVVAMLFVSAPYTVNAARLGFEALDPRLEKVARTLGMGPWQALFQITLPLSWRSIMTGLTLTYARSISEFGAVVILVYYPMTAPVEIYELFLRFGLEDAAAAAVLLLVCSLALFILLRHFAYRRGTALVGGR